MTTPKENGQRKDWFSLRHKISQKMGLASPLELDKVVLTKEFLEPWATYRDTLPLSQKVVAKMVKIDDKNFIDESATKVYDSMDSMASCRWDEPTERKGWTLRDYLLCLVYQAARNLARPGEIFGAVFDRSSPTGIKYAAGRAQAKERIRGLVLLTLALVHCYSGVEPSDLVVKIETAKPTANPQYSPIKEVRIKHILERMGIDELRKVALNGHDEKQWLIKMILSNGLGTTVIESAEGTGAKEAATPEVGQKRKRDEDEVAFVSSQTVKRG